MSVQSIGSPHDAHGLERESPVAGAGPPAYLERPIGRIAVICYHTSPLVQPGGRDAGGMNVYVRETAGELGKLGYAVDVFTRSTRRGGFIHEISPNVRVVALPAGPERPVEKSLLPLFVQEFAEQIATFRLREGLRYDVLHSHYWLSGLAGVYLQRRWEMPHVTMFHTLGEVKNRARMGEHEPVQRVEGEHQVVASADRIVCATPHEATLLRDLYGAASDCMTVVPCGVDTDLFRPHDREEAGREIGAPGERVILYAGRIEALKGIDIALEALARLETPRPLFIIAGGDRHASPEVRRLEEAARRLGVEDRVRFVGAVPQPRLPLYYAAADVCVVPSYYESFGMAALEAQACGTPVVATRVGGLPGVVRDGETGYLVPWRCPEPFAQAIDVLLHNRALRESFGRSARAWSLNFRWEAIAGRLANLYASLSAEWTLNGCHTPGLQRAKDLHVRCEVA